MRLGRVGIGIMAALLLPYAVTLAWSGRVGGNAGSGQGWLQIGRGAQEGSKENGETKALGVKRIYIENGQKGYVQVEDYLAGIVARQIPAEYELEALKAQAIIARTYIYGRMEGKTEVTESELGLRCLGENQMESLWGRQNFVEYYDKICQAVRETEGLVIALEESQEILLEPLFHRASSGYTRDGDEAHGYLKSVDSQWDVEAEGYLTVVEWEPKDVVRLITEAAKNNGLGEVELTEEEVMDTIQLVGREKSGYVKEIQIGAHIYTGEEIRQALGLPSAAFTLEEYEGKIRAVCKGIGHGYGLSQYGANGMAREGKGAEEILKYYYQNIEIISPKT